MRKFVLATMLFIIPYNTAQAEVIASAANGFSIKHEFEIQAPVSQVYRNLSRIGNWWPSDHTWSGDAKNLSLQLRPGGCFCEKLENGGVEHMHIIYLRQNTEVRMSGALGPLQKLGAEGRLGIKFDAISNNTKMTITFDVGGFAPDGLDKLAPIVNMVIGQQFTALKEYSEGTKK